MQNDKLGSCPCYLSSGSPNIALQIEKEETKQNRIYLLFFSSVFPNTDPLKSERLLFHSLLQAVALPGVKNQFHAWTWLSWETAVGLVKQVLHPRGAPYHSKTPPPPRGCCRCGNLPVHPPSVEYKVVLFVNARNSPTTRP